MKNLRVFLLLFFSFAIFLLLFFILKKKKRNAHESLKETHTDPVSWHSSADIWSDRD